MPNRIGGRNFKKGKKGKFNEIKNNVVKEDGQEYAQVINPKGNGRFELKCCDNVDRLGSVSGKMRKRIWINRSDIVLICKWEDMTNDNKCSIVHKYTESEAKRLLKDGELPKNFKLNLDDVEEFATNNDEDYFKGISDSESDEESVEETKNSDDSSDESSDEQLIDLDEI